MSTNARASNRQDQLLDAARAVLVRDGYRGISLRTVAREAGVGLSTLQYVFRTRAELLDALVERVQSDAGYREYSPGNRGLQRELAAVAAWYGERVLDDDGMRELVRAELEINLARAGVVVEGDPYRPVITGGLHVWLETIYELSGEEWSITPATVAQLATHAFTGLTYQDLRHRDRVTYQEESAIIISAIVALADPRPKVP